MEWDKFKDNFHPSWWNKIKPFIESPECDKIYTFLKETSKRGVRILPDSSNTFRCFKETSLDELKIILFSYCPYHTLVNGIPCSDGLAFSNGLVDKMSPSLQQFYRGLELDLYDGVNLSYIKNNDLSYLCKEGVLLWNSALTCEYQKPGKHQSIWEPFTKYMLENVFSYTGIPMIMIGKDAAYYKRYMTPLTHGFHWEVEHMAFAARENRDWDTKGVFKRATKLIKDMNGYEIKWVQEYE